MYKYVVDKLRVWKACINSTFHIDLVPAHESSPVMSAMLKLKTENLPETENLLDHKKKMRRNIKLGASIYLYYS